MKISVREKMKEAEQMSLQHPDVFYMVIRPENVQSLLVIFVYIVNE